MQFEEVQTFTAVPCLECYTYSATGHLSFWAHSQIGSFVNIYYRSSEKLGKSNETSILVTLKMLEIIRTAPTRVKTKQHFSYICVFFLFFLNIWNGKFEFSWITKKIKNLEIVFYLYVTILGDWWNHKMA